MTVQYVIQICEEFENAANKQLSQKPQIGPRQVHSPELNSLFLALADEIQPLIASDFPPDQRAEFAKLRKSLTWEIPPADRGQLVKVTDQLIQHVQRMKQILMTFGSSGSQLATVDFSFIGDTQLRQIVERDYQELRLKLFPGGAWKSTVILAGSILEAVLYDVLTFDTSVCASANGANRAPCKRINKPKKPLPTDDWTLSELIDVAEEINKIPAQHANCIDEVLRGYRNFVHPRREVRAQHECDEPQAYLAIGALGVVFNHLSTPP